MRARIATMLVFVTAMAACGGSSSETPPPPPLRLPIADEAPAQEGPDAAPTVDAEPDDEE